MPQAIFYNITPLVEKDDCYFIKYFSSAEKKIRFEIAPLKRLSVYIELQEDKKIEIRQIYRLHLKDEPAVEKLNDLEDLLFKSLQEDMDPDLQKTKKA